MATVQTTGIVTQENKTFYDRTLLSRLTPNLVFAQYGQKKAAPKREGDTVNFRRFNSLTAATTALTEGTPPAGNSLSVTAITATVAQYGDFVLLSDKLDMVGIDPVLTETAAVLGEQAGLTVDTVVRDIIIAGTNVQYASTANSRATVGAAMVLTGAEIKKAVRTLRKNNAKPHPQGNGCYVGIITPGQEYDLMADSMWQDVSKYSASEQIFKGEIGRLYGVRFVRSSNSKVFTGAGAASADVHIAMIIGEGAYGVVDIDGGSKPEMIIKAHGESGTADPLNQVASAGWKTLFTAKILNDLAMVRIETGATP